MAGPRLDVAAHPGGRDLVVTATTGADLPATTTPVLLAWTALTAFLGVTAYRGDEGRRFR